ncbi:MULTISPECIES: sn-glycerol-3-phosphate ABC transporter ATP-binding protein UgpC [unclassified Devosia]|uniref:ABC transporter ATP-binding protein n=1 Tax=unclassified Devosia TaxID=196773 RepID=UPI00145E572D|nr:sn-glycerol-3-phosphate ABC transporter ATP-binding protein UgpC [Devosia sp. MC521]MBJ6988114.1 sn-glycerol-3-phosphate ABC transporter ATP-binding protein UgpC [Devosia sp. MC521]QMW63400.1 sn-glycerol-3-phosphate ABC transporter ATP-binding protein UgpC [Devosia sp. MC521]
MAQLSLRGIKKSFRSVDVLHGVDLEIGDKEFVVFVGPSGCGKSTLLRLIAGLDPLTGGDFYLNGQLMNDVPPSKRGIAMVFQSYALYPHMDVYENMAFGARLMGLSKEEVESRIAEAARMLRLEPLLKRKPRELSGGQRQRVAIGRALVRKPSVFLLDEPLSNLDAALRSEVRLEIARLHRQIGGTMIYVTHDQVEAMTLADKIVVMNAGRIEQVGSPRELYETPANTFVASFIGSPRMTLVDVVRAGDRLELAGNGGSVSVGELPAGDEFKLGLRSDAVGLSRDITAAGFAAHVVYTEYLGDNAYVYVRLVDGTLLAARTGPDDLYQPDTAVTVTVLPGSAHLFSATDGRRI